MVAAPTTSVTKRPYGPDDVEVLAFRVAHKVRESGAMPDAIVGMAPEVAPAHLVAEELGIDNVASIQVRRFDENGPVEILSSPVWAYGHHPTRVLLVAHAMDEGAYMHAAYTHLRMAQGLSVWTAALVATGRRAALGSWQFPNVDFFGELRYDVPDFYWKRNQR